MFNSVIPSRRSAARDLSDAIHAFSLEEKAHSNCEVHIGCASVQLFSVSATRDDKNWLAARVRYFFCAIISSRLALNSEPGSQVGYFSSFAT